MTNDKIAIAKIGRAHGLHGDVRVRFFSDDPEACCAREAFWISPEKDARRLICASRRPGNTMDIVHFAGVDTREGAEALSGLTLYQARGDFAPLSNDEFYYADLLGLRVLRASDRSLVGTVADIFRNAATDILVVQPAGTGAPAAESTVCIPFTHAALPVVRIEEGWILAEDTYLT
jgi:16S rRNA processing protein RimM